jgi:WXG100 family type VII secretion target
MSELKVNFGGLQAASADINASADKLAARLDQLDSDLAPLRADWSGEAAGAYEAAKAKWSAAITDMRALLAQVGQAVATSGSDYQSTERSNASMW